MSNDNENALTEAFGGAKNLPTAFSPQALMQSTAAIPKTTDKPYLVFKDGEWTFGQDAAECDPDAVWAVNPHSFHFGLIEWLDSVAGGEILVPAGTPYRADELVCQLDTSNPDHRIVPQIAVDLYCCNGDDEGLQVCFKTSTRGGVDALNKLAQAIAKQGVEDPDRIVAIVSLGESSYMHKKYKRKTYVPILDLVRFDDFELSETRGDAGEEEGGEEEEAQQQQAAPPARSRGKGNSGKGGDAPPARRRRNK